MEYFLERIAKQLYSEFGNTLNRHCLVFPSRRAGLYLLKYLSVCINKPVWAPPILTINDLFRQQSTLQIAGNEVLLFELYKVYRLTKEVPVSFDDFFFWGDMLLNDFDDIDKYLVDASLLFRNIKDLKEIDQIFGGLTPEQVEIIRRFWINFNPAKPTEEKEGFKNIWSILHAIYTDFAKSLRGKNLAYEGMIFRDVAERGEVGFLSGTGWDMVHFIGFNALNRCEKTIMSRLKKDGKARFYWDYDNSYIRDGQSNSAGFFMRDNLKMFGNDMSSDWNYNTVLSSPLKSAKRCVIATSSDVAQVKLIPDLIDELADINPDNSHHTAVVLADENLIMPVLSSLPVTTGDINITMGYPLKETRVYTLVRHLMDLQGRSAISGSGMAFASREVIDILRHPLVRIPAGEACEKILAMITTKNLAWISSAAFSDNEILKHIFTKPGSPSLLSDYFKDIMSLIVSQRPGSEELSGKDHVQENITNEYIYRVVLSLNRLESIIGSSEVILSNETYMRILDRLLRMQSVPFSGEPLSGVQIMGILETRALDFKNLIILSVTEGVLPSVSAGSSYIPFSLREAFGLPSVNHQESIYAYHFYRLLHRAENVTLVYNSNPEGLRSGEMSRFITQMKYDEDLKPEFTDLKFEIRTPGIIPESLERTEEHNSKLIARFSDGRRLLSPSAINTWLACRMKFFYRYVTELKEPENISNDIDPAALGSILHESMRIIYSPHHDKFIEAETIKILIDDRKFLNEVIARAVKEKFRESDESNIAGNELIVRDVLLEYLIRILRSDKSVAPFKINHLEEYFNFKMGGITDNSSAEVSIGGQVDRIDSKANVVRIVDYKTGAVADSITSPDELFEEERSKELDPWLQTLLYCEAYLSINTETIVKPSVYKIRKIGRDQLSDSLIIKTDKNTVSPLTDYNDLREQFMDGLRELVKKIFGPNEPFTMTSDRRGKCSYCPYRGLCMR